MNKKFFQLSDKSTWLTPASIFAAINLEFDLDPAHPGRDNPYCSVPARRIYAIHDDGLRQPWSGRVWLNPPFAGVTHKYLGSKNFSRMATASRL